MAKYEEEITTLSGENKFLQAKVDLLTAKINESEGFRGRTMSAGESSPKVGCP